MGNNFCKISASRVPFSIKFRTNQDEDTKLKGRDIADDETVNGPAVTGVTGAVSPGYLGFSLNFLQEAC